MNKQWESYTPQPRLLQQQWKKLPNLQNKSECKISRICHYTYNIIIMPSPDKYLILLSEISLTEALIETCVWVIKLVYIHPAFAIVMIICFKFLWLNSDQHGTPVCVCRPTVIFKLIILGHDLQCNSFLSPACMHNLVPHPLSLKSIEMATPITFNMQA